MHILGIVSTCLGLVLKCVCGEGATSFYLYDGSGALGGMDRSFYLISYTYVEC